MRVLHLWLAAAALLVGCATEEGYRKLLDSYLNASESELLGQFGVPDSTYTAADGTRYLTYRVFRSGYVPGMPPIYQTTCSFGVCTTTEAGSSPAFQYSTHCKTTFALVAGKVAKWTFEGNACQARI